MFLHVYSLQKPVFEKPITSVSLKTSQGEITILDNHRPLITLIEPGLIRIVEKDGKENRIEAQTGFVEVRPKGEVNILLD